MPQAGELSIGSDSSSTPITRTFTPPIIVTGTTDMTSGSSYGGDTVSFTSGSALNPSDDKNEAVVGKALAEKNGLSVGSTFTAYDETITVVGIYDSGNSFSNAGVIMTLASLQRLSDQSGAVTSATVTVDSVDNLEAATTAVKNLLGDAADVVSNQETATNAIAPLENVKSISLYSLLGALGAGAVIILLTMVMIARERRREIGVLKAIGSSNVRTMLQFVSESVTLTLIGMVVGIGIGIATAGPITNALVTNSSSNTTQLIQAPGQGRNMRISFSSGISTVRDVQANVGVDILAYGFGAALLIAVVGSALPALLISKIRPAEVMRAE